MENGAWLCFFSEAADRPSDFFNFKNIAPFPKNNTQAEGGWAGLFDAHAGSAGSAGSAASPPSYTQLPPAVSPDRRQPNGSGSSGSDHGGGGSPSPTGKRRSKGKVAPGAATAAAASGKEKEEWLGIAGEVVVGYGSGGAGGSVVGVGTEKKDGQGKERSRGVGKTKKVLLVPASSSEEDAAGDEDAYVGYQYQTLDAAAGSPSPYNKPPHRGPATHAQPLPLAAADCGAILEAERRTPLWKPLALTACFVGILVTDVLKVGGGIV